MTAADPLAVLLDRAARNALNPAEAEQLRTAVSELRQPASKMQTVQGHCPACRDTSLLLGEGGHVTCSRLECPDPAAADDLLGQADAAVAEALDIEHANLTAEIARADRYRAAWQSARARAHHARCILADHRVEADARKARQPVCDHRDPNRLGMRRDLATVCVCGHTLFPPILGQRPDEQL